jgi:NAD(P)-dependent dehydrogenase (short-subunit alcohol dehydrogenase family)
LKVATTQQSQEARPFAIVTGASSGLGYELALRCARHGFDLLVAAHDPRIFEAAKVFSAEGVSVDPMQIDLDTIEDVDQLYAEAKGRPVDALLANAGRELGGAFLDREFEDIRRAIDTNITGTMGLVHRVGREMRARRQGRMLIAGSMLDAFAGALRTELQDAGGVTVTSLPLTLSLSGREALDAATLARIGFEAMMRGDDAATVSFPAAQARTASRR